MTVEFEEIALLETRLEFLRKVEELWLEEASIQDVARMGCDERYRKVISLSTPE